MEILNGGIPTSCCFGVRSMWGSRRDTPGTPGTVWPVDGSGQRATSYAVILLWVFEVLDFGIWVVLKWYEMWDLEIW